MLSVREQRDFDTAKPLDYSFKSIKKLKGTYIIRQCDIPTMTQRHCTKKPPLEFKKTEELITDTEFPLDLSFKYAKELKGVGLEGPRETRTGKIPERGKINRKYLTKAIWLNNNKLTTTKDMDVLVDSVLEHPEKLAWIDFSFNYITTIDEGITKFQNLKIVYFHGNKISDIEQVFKLRNLKQLRSVTFHGNPINEHPQYRAYVIAALPQIVNLDFTPVLGEEKKRAIPPDAMKKIQQLQPNNDIG